MPRPVTHESLFNALVAVDEARSAGPLTPEQRLDHFLAALAPTPARPPTPAPEPSPPPLERLLTALAPTHAPQASPTSQPLERLLSALAPTPAHSPPSPAPAANASPAEAPLHAEAPPPGTLFERVRGLLHDHESLLARYHADFDRLFDPTRVDPAAAGLLPAEADDDERLLDRLRRAQVLMLKYPIAVQAALSALVAEGRRFAATPEGARLQAALADSELVRRGRAVWEAASLRTFTEDPPGTLPSAYLDAFLQAARAPELEALLARLFTDRPTP